MPHTFEELNGKTLEDLRNIAQGIDDEAVRGFSQMNKAHLLPALCQALGIDAHIHHHADGIDKVAIKTQMRELRKRRVAALETHDHELLKRIRRQAHHLNRQIREHLH